MAPADHFSALEVARGLKKVGDPLESNLTSSSSFVLHFSRTFFVRRRKATSSSKTCRDSHERRSRISLYAEVVGNNIRRTLFDCARAIRHYTWRPAPTSLILSVSVPLRRCAFTVVVISLFHHRKLPVLRGVCKPEDLEKWV